MTTWFVASTGNDTNAGTSGAPWLTVGHAANSASVVAGDTVTVADGTYNENVQVTRGGSAGNLVTYKSTNPRGAKIVGGAGGGTGVPNQSAFNILTSYLVFDGFDVSQTGDQHGFCGSDAAALHTHHITIQN